MAKFYGEGSLQNPESLKSRKENYTTAEIALTIPPWFSGQFHSGIYVFEKKIVNSVTGRKKKSLMGNYHEDENRLVLLKSGKEEAWRDWYDEMREPFRLFFIRYGNMEPETALSLYHDAMVIFHANVREEKLVTPLKSTLRTYIFGIGKILLRKQGVQLDQNVASEIPDIPIQPNVEVDTQRRENAALVRQLLNKLGDPCKKLLELIYIKGFAMEAAAEAMEIPSAGAVRKRKFDCLKKLRNLMNQDNDHGVQA